ncbi:glycoside hydrolase family 28 protein [Microbacterium sp. NPDC056569]|uniref:glycoside hydrolase family 28 protein n=1 Tax=Microbacterium sp. NPDC056569 TaxID=3345867 RepID=UPI003671A0BC
MPHTFDPRDFGAIGDGTTLDTAALQAALDACGAAGGGLVAVEDGTYLTGTLFLRSRVELHVAASARLLASPDIADYPEDVHHNRYRNEPELDRCLLLARDVEHVTLSGPGEINGNGPAFPQRDTGQRAMMLRTLRASHVRVRDLRLLDAAGWTTAFLDSRWIWVEGVRIHNESNFNGDGLNFDGCEHVFVRGCHIVGTDDNICLQSSSEAYPTRNIHISDCELSSVCAGIRIGLKSIGTISDVTVRGITMNRILREGVKIECTEGGTITRIAISDVVMHDVRRPVWILLNNRFEPDDLGSSIELDQMPPIGELSHVRITGLTAVDSADMALEQWRFDHDIQGTPEFAGMRVDAARSRPIRNLTLRDITYVPWGGVREPSHPFDEYPEVVDALERCTEGTSSNYYPTWSRTTFLDVRNVDQLRLDAIVLEAQHPDARPPYVIEGCTVLNEDVTVLAPV